MATKFKYFAKGGEYHFVVGPLENEQVGDVVRGLASCLRMFVASVSNDKSDEWIEEALRVFTTAFRNTELKDLVRE